MAGADVSGPRLGELVQERGEAAERQEDDQVTKRERVLKKPKRQTKRIRATVRIWSAAGSSSPPRQLPPPCLATIHHLPDEVLAQIFGQLSLHTIVNVVSVCERWKGVVEDWTLNKKLKFEPGRFTAQEAQCLIRSAPNLKSLELIELPDTIALLNAASARCTNLLHLSVICHDVSSFSLTGALRKVFRTSPDITRLLLSYTSTSKNLRFYQELGGLLPDLRKLELDIDHLSHLQLDTLIVGCSRNQMEELKAPDNPFCEEHIAKLVEFWGRSLRVLELAAYNFTDCTWALLAGCSELRCLTLVGLNNHGDWLCGLAALSHLEELHLEYASGFNPENFCSLFSQSRSSHRLCKLSLIGCSKVDDRVLASVAAFCPQMEVLVVMCKDMTISGGRKVLRCCRKLHTLHLYVTDAALILSELPQLAPQLRRICIGYHAMWSVDDATLSLVRAQMPHLSIG